ncbi:AraC family transcriptional regulator [Paenibacillus sp. MMS20-IR301]|uniref:AraC family transcriptional regulator n=1 Tax=Paenibacillus sp. MMS20-IR301 TaxID=2895946 RepID=UPI0028E5391D|nr:AraC family transcriptional regulator [Paenibacillus sp. MMS20-IR301]WNS45254.1 AraC family transcriptional regulator [Paenibacillus sp. MMS20-IR301]
MSIRHSTYTMTGEGFFEPGVPIFVNRAFETFDLSEHSHEFVEITYVSEGSGVHYIGGEAVPVQHGTLFFIPVGRSHVFRPMTLKKDRPLIVYNCLFPVHFLADLKAGFPQFAEVYRIFEHEELSWFAVKDTTGEYHGMFREMYREFSAKPPGYLPVLASLVVRVLTGLYRHRMQPADTAADKPQWLTVDEAIAYIDGNYASVLRLGEFAAKANLSERQFSRLFRQQTGMSFIDYVQGSRMDAACRLLTASRLSVTEIADTVGYTDMKFFHQLFKKKIGTTPREYRNTLQAGPGGSRR